VTLVRSLSSLSELAQRRGLLDASAARDVGALASELEGVFEHAASGDGRSRDATIAVASWVAWLLDGGSSARLEAVHAVAVELGHPLTSSIFAPRPAPLALARLGRLPEVCVPARSGLSATMVHVCYEQVFDGDEPTDANFVAHRVALRPTLDQRRRALLDQRHREHPDPIFIRRLLDQPWLRPEDVVVIAARRPTTPPITLAVATRDRWLRNAHVQYALAVNPFTPAQLAAALLPALPVATIRTAAPRSGVARALLELRA